MHEEFNKKLENNALTKESMLNLAVVNPTKVIGDLSVWYNRYEGYCGNWL